MLQVTFHEEASNLHHFLRQRISALRPEGRSERAQAAGGGRSHLLADGLQSGGARETGRTKEGLRNLLRRSASPASECQQDHRRHLRRPNRGDRGPLMRNIRYLDKLVDELAKGR